MQTEKQFVDGTKKPRIESDGTHVIPVQNLYDSENTRIDFVTGEVRWSPINGVTFRFEFSGWGNAPIGRCSLGSDKSDGAGTILALPRRVDWTAETYDSGYLKAIGTNPSVSCCSNRTGMSLETSTTVSGSMCYLFVDLPIDNTFAFEKLDNHTSRLFSTGFNCHKWPEMLSVNRLQDFGASSSMGRGELVLSSKKTISVFSAESTHKLKDGVFLSTNSAFPGLDAILENQSGDEFQDFLAFVSGSPTRGFWREWNSDDDKRLHRLYLGWKTDKRILNREGISQPMPLSGTTEAFEHCSAVTDRLPTLFENWQHLPQELQISHYMTPIWLAFDAFWEDRLFLACIALERFANSMHKSGLMDSGKPAPVVPSEKWSCVRRQLLNTLNDSQSPTKLSEEKMQFLIRKIDNINQPPNSDKLTRCFESLGLKLSQNERNAISLRNRMLHGSKAFKNQPNNEDHNTFALHFDVPRTLLHKVTLAILHYDGPFVDYASREAKSNFRIAWFK